MLAMFFLLGSPLLAFLAFLFLRLPLGMALRGHRMIYVKGVSSAVTDWWTANAIRDPFGCLMAYRYPSTKIGQVTLNEDGTGYYCGPVIWKYVFPEPALKARDQLG